MIWDQKYPDVLAKAEHLIALGETTVYLRDEPLPWDSVDTVKRGAGVRLSGPTSCQIIAHVNGLTLKWSVEFEACDANGRGVSLFDRDRLREVARKLPPKARKAFAALLRNEVLPTMEKHTAEIREALNKQEDSEDCVRGLIAFAAK